MGRRGRDSSIEIPSGDGDTGRYHFWHSSSNPLVLVGIPSLYILYSMTPSKPAKQVPLSMYHYYTAAHQLGEYPTPHVPLHLNLASDSLVNAPPLHAALQWYHQSQPANTVHTKNALWASGSCGQGGLNLHPNVLGRLPLPGYCIDSRLEHISSFAVKKFVLQI